MPAKKDNDFIKNYEKIRPVLRDIFLYGCFYRRDFQDKRGISAPKVDNEKRKFIAFLDSRFVSDKNGKSLKRRKFLQLLYNMFYVQDNYLKTTYFIKKISTDKAKRIIAILLMLSKCKKATTTEIRDNYRDVYAAFYESDGTDPDQKVSRCLKELTDNGYLTAVTNKNALNYALSQDIFQNFTETDFEEISLLIQFFSGISPISVPGYSLQNIIRLYRQQKQQTAPTSQAFFLFKGSQIKQILEEEAASKLLANIAKQEIITFEYHKPYQNWKEYKPVRPIKLLLDIFYVSAK